MRTASRHSGKRHAEDRYTYSLRDSADNSKLEKGTRRTASAPAWASMGSAPRSAPLSAPASRLHHPRTPHPLQLLLPALLVLLLLLLLLLL